MAHPYEAHRDKHTHERVAHITRGYASGGAVRGTGHSDEAADRRLVKKMLAEHERKEMEVEGKLRHRMDRAPRRARGGKVKKHGKVNVNVVVAPQQHGAPSPGLAPMAGPPPAAVPMRPPMAGPPGMPPGGPPMPPPGIRRNGGRAYGKGGAVKPGPAWNEGLKSGTQVQHSPNKSDGKDIGRGRVVTFWAGGSVKRKTGGKVESPQGVAPATRLPGGSGGGEARLAKERRAARDYARA